MAGVKCAGTTPLPNEVTTPELLTLLARMQGAIVAARKWVPATAPEMVRINAVDAEIKRHMAAIQVSTCDPAPAEGVECFPLGGQVDG